MTEAESREELGLVLPRDTPTSFFSLWAYWRSIQHEKVCPDAADFDPMKLARLLPDISIYELRAPDQIIYRLAGTAIAERMGHDPTGENLIELTSDVQKDFASQLFTRIAETPAGVYLSYENTYASGRQATVQSLLLPLSLTDETQDNVSRVVAIHHMGAAREYKAAQYKTTVGNTIDETVWIDLGAGIPRAQD